MKFRSGKKVKGMFEDFTEKAIKAIMMAQDEARRLGHNFVGTEQLLLGLIAEGTGAAARVLKTKGVSLKDARVEVERIIQRGSGFVSVEIPFTPRAQKVLQDAREVSKNLKLDCIATEHMLIGILESGEGVAIAVLQSMGVDCYELKQEVIKVASEREGARSLDHRNINLIDQCEEIIRIAERIERVNERVRTGIQDLCGRDDITKPEAEKIAVEIQESLSRVEDRLKKLTKTPSSFSKEKDLVGAWSKKLK